MWILFVLIYGILKGVRDIAKKKALSGHGVVEVLFVYTIMSFAMTVPASGNVTGVPLRELLLIAFKSFVIVIAFLCSFYVIDRMPISLYGVLDLSRVLFSMTLGILILKEQPGVSQLVAFFLIAAGLLLLRYRPKSQRTETEVSERVPGILYIIAFVSTSLNAISGTMDKILMGGGKITSGQLQFWYMFFMLVYYGIYVLVSRTRIHFKELFKNPWLWMISILFVIADRFLFIANSYSDSRVTIMTLLKQVCCIVTIIGGKFIFKEKNTLQRFICAAIIIAGIVVSVI